MTTQDADAAPVVVDERVLHLAYEEGVRTLQHQDSEVDTIRGQMLRMLSISGAATAFAAGSSLVSDSSNKGPSYTIAVFATLALAWLLKEVRAVLKPIPDWYSEADPQYIVDKYADKGFTLAETHRILIEHYGRYQEKNHRKLTGIRDALRRAQIAATVQVVAWVALAWVAIGSTPIPS